MFAADAEWDCFLPLFLLFSALAFFSETLPECVWGGGGEGVSAAWLRENND